MAKKRRSTKTKKGIALRPSRDLPRPPKQDLAVVNISNSDLNRDSYQKVRGRKPRYILKKIKPSRRSSRESSRPETYNDQENMKSMTNPNRSPARSRSTLSSASPARGSRAGSVSARSVEYWVGTGKVEHTVRANGGHNLRNVRAPKKYSK